MTDKLRVLKINVVLKKKTEKKKKTITGLKADLRKEGEPE